MKRKALLIESSRLPGHPDLPGARVDIDNWKRFLLSLEGGAWELNEIDVLSHPTISGLEAKLAAEAATDYVFITFSGHGYYLKGKDIEDSILCLNAKDEIPVSRVNAGNPRSTLVVDTCRKVVLVKSAALTFMSANEALLNRALGNRDSYRKCFDDALQLGEKGIIRMFSCDLDEAAGESENTGGFYSSALVQCCVDWHNRAAAGKRQYYSTWNAHECAAAKTTLREMQQHPKYAAGRRLTHFPMAVKV